MTPGDPSEPVPCSPDHHTPAGGENMTGIEIHDNQDRDCLTIRQEDPVDKSYNLVHVCDWPALRAAIDQHQRERGGRT